MYYYYYYYYYRRASPSCYRGASPSCCSILSGGKMSRSTRHRSDRKEPAATQEGRPALVGMDEPWLPPFASVDINDMIIIDRQVETQHIVAANLVVGGEQIPISPIAMAEQAPIVTYDIDESAASSSLVRHGNQ